MTVEQIIAKFEIYVDDTTELSASDEIALCDKIAQKVAMNRPWEALKTTSTGFLSTTVPYVSLPDDFGSLIEDNQDTLNNTSITNNARPTVVYVGSSLVPYQIINWSDRRAHRSGNYAYLDVANNRLTFPTQPTATDAYEFDYVRVPATLASITDIPWMPARFHDMLYHGMAVQDEIIQRFPKAQGYADQNQLNFNDYLASMALWNASLRAE